MLFTGFHKYACFVELMHWNRLFLGRFALNKNKNSPLQEVAQIFVEKISLRTSTRFGSALYQKNLSLSHIPTFFQHMV